MRRILSTLAVTVAVAGSLAVPVAANADTVPEIRWAASDPNHLARVQVSAAAAAGIASIVVQVLKFDDPDQRQVVAEVTDFKLTSGDDTDGVWESPQLTLPEMRLYGLGVEVTDKAGGHAENPFIGNLTYGVQTSFDHLKSTKTVTYDDRNFVVSGRLLGRWPTTDEVKPAAGLIVNFSTWDSGSVSTVTGADGYFTVSAPVLTVPDMGFLGLGLNPLEPVYYLGVGIDIASPTIKPSPARLTATADTHAITAGDPVTLTGNLSRRSPTGWRPAADEQVTAAAGTATTDADGNYTMVVFPQQTGAVVVSATGDPFLRPATSKAVTVTVTPGA